MIPANELIHDPVTFAESMLMVQDKARKLIPLTYNKAQRHYLEHRTSRDLILKARQLGFSTCIQADMFRLYTTGSEAMLTMADTNDNTAKLRRIANRYYEKLPPNMPKPVRSESNASVTVYPDVGSEVQISTAGGRSGGRAGTYTLLHGSEVAYWIRADKTIAGALETVPEHVSDTWVVFESTANGAQGWFYDECMAALRGESEWTLHFYAWWWDDDYQIPLDPSERLTYTEDEQRLVDAHNLTPAQIKWRRKKQRDLKSRFQEEYPESPQQAFITSGGGVFTLGADNVHSQPVAYDSNHLYVGGVDWGQNEDYTTLSIIEVHTDGTPNREVYVNRWRKQSWAQMRGYIVDELKAWHVEKVVVEKNSMGTVNIEDLVNDIEDANLDCSIQAFTTTNRSKDMLVKTLQKALDEEGMQLLDTDYANHELRTYITKQTASGLWTYTHPDGGHDDTVDARMLANYAANNLWI